MQFPSAIFRKYDIRGSVAGDNPQITPELANAVGKGYGTYMQRTHHTERVYVGCDNRPTSPLLKKALIEGLLSTGVDVTDIGDVMTPSVYYASAQHGARAGGIQITGSHLSLEFNGIKMAYDRFALYGDQIQAIRALIEADDFLSGSGTLTHDTSLVAKHMQTIASKVTMGSRKLKIVLDAGNSLSGLYMQPVYAQLGIEVICLYCEPDGTFPNHLPNPEDPELTKDLEAKVKSTGADLGIGFDGDADRCGLIDDHAHHVPADRLIAMLARDMLKRHPGAKVVFDVKASAVLPDEIKRYGGEPLMWKSGHSLMKLKMSEEGALLGGEVSGHIFIGEDYYGFDDAPLVALKALEILSKSDKSISQILDEMPKLVATPEIILAAPDDVKFDIIRRVHDRLADKYEVVTVDGARAIFENGWGLVRASNTQPAITLRFEAYSNQDIVEYMEKFHTLLGEYPQVDRTKLKTQMEMFKA